MSNSFKYVSFIKDVAVNETEAGNWELIDEEVEWIWSNDKGVRIKGTDGQVTLIPWSNVAYATEE